MSIEIRQMVVKSNVLQREEEEVNTPCVAHEDLQKIILDECKKLIVSTLQDMKER